MLKGVLQNRYRIQVLLKVMKSDTKRDLSVVKESFSNMSAPMISRENARCVILPISSLLATLGYDICFVKLPLAWGSTRGTLFSKEIHTQNGIFAR